MAPRAAGRPLPVILTAIPGQGEYMQSWAAGLAQHQSAAVASLAAGWMGGVDGAHSSGGGCSDVPYPHVRSVHADSGVEHSECQNEGFNASRFPIPVLKALDEENIRSTHCINPCPAIPWILA